MTDVRFFVVTSFIITIMTLRSTWVFIRKKLFRIGGVSASPLVLTVERVAPGGQGSQDRRICRVSPPSSAPQPTAHPLAGPIRLTFQDAAVLESNL